MQITHVNLRKQLTQQRLVQHRVNWISKLADTQKKGSALRSLFLSGFRERERSAKCIRQNYYRNKSQAPYNASRNHKPAREPHTK